MVTQQRRRRGRPAPPQEGFQLIGGELRVVSHEERKQMFQEMAEDYMDALAHQDEWVSLLQSIYEVHGFNTAERLSKSLKTLVELFPTPEAVLEQCPIPLERLDGLGLRSRPTVSKLLCQAAEDWLTLREDAKSCEPGAMQPRFGFSWKSSDMLQLDVACRPTVVADLHMWRRFCDPESTLTPERISKLQSKQAEYFECRGEIVQQARNEGTDPAVFHVREWLDQAFAGDVVRAQRFARELFEGG